MWTLKYGNEDSSCYAWPDLRRWRPHGIRASEAAEKSVSQHSLQHGVRIFEDAVIETIRAWHPGRITQRSAPARENGLST
jgi:hypothetical protein